MISNEHVASTTERYLSTYPSDEPAIEPLLTALKENDGPLATRSRLSGHVTASGYVLDTAGRVLLIQHNTLSRFLQPGGHTEPEDNSILEAAKREVAEETGLSDIELLSNDPIHIGVHRIPYSRAKNEPEHWHFDFQYVFTLTKRDSDVRLQEDEVCDFAWVPIDELAEPVPRKRLQQLATEPLW